MSTDRTPLEPLSPTSSQPLYLQIKTLLAKRIQVVITNRMNVCHLKVS